MCHNVQDKLNKRFQKHSFKMGFNWILTKITQFIILNMSKIPHNLFCKKCWNSRYFCGRILTRILRSWKVYELFHAGLVWKANFRHFFGNILGLGTYFQNWFWRWNSESESVDLNTMNPIIQTSFFSTFKGVRAILSAYFRIVKYVEK